MIRKGLSAARRSKAYKRAADRGVNMKDIDALILQYKASKDVKARPSALGRMLALVPARFRTAPVEDQRR